jgi:hypothetical protein
MTAPEVETAKKGLAVSVERVVMAQGTYPKMWKHQSQPDEAE